jgi:hypothetical protein
MNDHGLDQARVTFDMGEAPSQDEIDRVLEELKNLKTTAIEWVVEQKNALAD